MLALVIGGGPNVRAESADALRLAKPDHVLIINDVGTIWGGEFGHWVSLHPERWHQWVAMRRARGFPTPHNFWSNRRYTMPKGCSLTVHPDYQESGLSGLYACKIAIEKLDCDKIMLAGVPMDKSGHLMPGRGHWINLERRRAWLEQTATLMGRAKSWSGWTRETFGVPTREWINAESVGARRE